MKAFTVGMLAMLGLLIGLAYEVSLATKDLEQLEAQLIELRRQREESERKQGHFRKETLDFLENTIVGFQSIESRIAELQRRCK